MLSVPRVECRGYDPPHDCLALEQGVEVEPGLWEHPECPRLPPAPRHQDDVVAHLTRILSCPLSYVIHDFRCWVRPHIDVLFFDGPNCTVLATLGASSEPLADGTRLELLMFLPVGFMAMWPVNSLVRAVRAIHEHQWIVGRWHTISNGDPPVSIGGGTAFVALLLCPPHPLPEEVCELVAGSGDRVSFLAAVPLHSGELRFARREGGLHAWHALFDRPGVGTFFDPDRPSFVRDGT